MDLYNDLPLSAAEDIRLLVLSPGEVTPKVRCKLRRASLGGKPVYTALSYAWGDPNKTEEISVNGQPINATLNLAALLRRIQRRVTGEANLWIDAVCINQKWRIEKEQQIKIMRSIYEQASNVMIWLGDARDDSDLVLSHMSMTREDVAKSSVMVDDKWVSRVAAARGYLFNQPWWSRL